MIQIHETDKHKIVAIEVPREETKFELSYDSVNGGYFLIATGSNEGYIEFFHKRQKPELLGTIGAGENTISEEQASEIVAPPNKDGIFLGLDEYHNYSDNDLLCCTTALGSLETLMESKGLVLENPLGEKPDEDDFEKYPLPVCFDPYEERKALHGRNQRIEKDWQDAENQLKRFVIVKIDK